MPAILGSVGKKGKSILTGMVGWAECNIPMLPFASVSTPGTGVHALTVLVDTLFVYANDRPWVAYIPL